MEHEPAHTEATTTPAAGPLPALRLVGVSAQFTPDELECLVRTAVDAVYGDPDGLSRRQLHMAARAHALMESEMEMDDSEPLA